MKKKIVLSMFFIMFFSAYSFGNTVDRETLIKWQTAVVKCNYQSLAATTGFIIHDNPCIVATAFHLIRDDASFVDVYPIYIKTHDEKVLKAKVVHFKKSCDLLLLQIEHTPEFWFSEYENAVNHQPCIALGLPYDWEIALEARIIKNRRFEAIGIDRVMIQGSSGSVILSREGKILGMATSIYGYTWITPGILIKNALGMVLGDG